LNFKSQMKAALFIIHLDRATERRANVDRLLRQSAFPSFVSKACDAIACRDTTLSDAYKTHCFKPHYPFALKTTEIACFQSHRLVWNELIQSGLEGAIVFEDDIDVVSSTFYSLVSDLLVSQYDFIKFDRVNDIAFFEQSKIKIRHAPPSFPTVGTYCYYVSARAARAFLDQSETFDRPVDAFMQMTWITGIPQLVVENAPVAEISSRLGGSTVQKTGQSNRWKKLLREIRRPLYRLELFAHFWWYTRIRPRHRP
jgi:GR25 family glycosyltransferase involved in LPS biosynthesis